MENYVSLSLETYNELYDKAKKYDELQVSCDEIVKEPITNPSYWDVVCISDVWTVPKGTRGHLIKKSDCCVVTWDTNSWDGGYPDTVDGKDYENVYRVSESSLRFLSNEREEN